MFKSQLTFTLFLIIQLRLNITRVKESRDQPHGGLATEGKEQKLESLGLWRSGQQPEAFIGKGRKAWALRSRGIWWEMWGTWGKPQRGPSFPCLSVTSCKKGSSWSFLMDKPRSSGPSWDVSWELCILGDFPGGSVAKNLPSSAGTQVWSLVRELRSHMPWGNQAGTL